MRLMAIQLRNSYLSLREGDSSHITFVLLAFAIENNAASPMYNKRNTKKDLVSALKKKRKAKIGTFPRSSKRAQQKKKRKKTLLDVRFSLRISI